MQFCNLIETSISEIFSTCMPFTCSKSFDDEYKFRFVHCTSHPGCFLHYFKMCSVAKKTIVLCSLRVHLLGSSYPIASFASCLPHLTL